MIRLLKEEDMDIACYIINENWKRVYSGYINNDLISQQGCENRVTRLKDDFHSHRLCNYVYEYHGKVVAVLSLGNTEDSDKLGAFELWRIYVDSLYQHKGIGDELIKYTEAEAMRLGYKEILIWAFKGNENAIRFYEKYGYKQDKEEYLGDYYKSYGVRFYKKII